MVLSLVLVLCVAALVVGAAVGWSRRRVIVIDPQARTVLVRLRHRSGGAVLLGLVLGGLAAAAMLIAKNGDLGRLASMAPAAGGTVAVLVVAFAELTTPHLEGEVRTPSLRIRRRLDAVGTHAETTWAGQAGRSRPPAVRPVPAPAPGPARSTAGSCSLLPLSSRWPRSLRWRLSPNVHGQVPRVWRRTPCCDAHRVVRFCS